MNEITHNTHTQDRQTGPCKDWPVHRLACQIDVLFVASPIVLPSVSFAIAR